MTQRPYLSMIQQAVNEDGVTFEEISPDYIYRVKRGNLSFIMHNLEIGLNNASSSKLANSKSSTYQTLTHAKIPAVEHFFLMNPASRFCAFDPFQLAAALFEQYEGQVVLKQDNGSQGNNVFRIRDQAELQEKLNYLFSMQLNAAISPYYESALEYRVVLLSHVPRIFLAKQRATSWKHNLISGAVSLEVDAETLPGLKQWASQTTKGMDLDFCSVDLLATAKGLMVLEVNDMVMLDEHLKQDPSRRDQIANLYRDAILARFEWLEMKCD